MIKKALIYRVGSMLLGFLLNTLFFETYTFALFVTFVFTVVMTAYYVVFHKVWNHTAYRSS